MSQCRWSVGSVNVFGRTARRGAGDRIFFHSVAHAPSRIATKRMQKLAKRNEKKRDCCEILTRRNELSRADHNWRNPKRIRNSPIDAAAPRLVIWSISSRLALARERATEIAALGIGKGVKSGKGVRTE